MEICQLPTPGRIARVTDDRTIAIIEDGIPPSGILPSPQEGKLYEELAGRAFQEAVTTPAKIMQALAHLSPNAPIRFGVSSPHVGGELSAALIRIEQEKSRRIVLLACMTEEY
jgi:hypothetical protein